MDYNDTSVEYTESLETIMLDQWIKCTQGDVRYVRSQVDRDSEQTEEDMVQWFRIYDEYIEKHGLSKHYKNVLEAMKELALLEVRYAKLMAKGEPDRFLETLIDIAEQKLSDLLQDNGQGMSIEDSLPILEKFFGFQIHTHNTRFIKYQSYLEIYGRASKA